jgi:hypothetical protein
VGPVYGYIEYRIDVEFRKLGVKHELEYVVREGLVVVPTSFYTFLLFQGYNVASAKAFLSSVTDGVYIYGYNGKDYTKVYQEVGVAFRDEVPAIPESCRLRWKVVGELERLYKIRVRSLL